MLQQTESASKPICTLPCQAIELSQLGLERWLKPRSMQLSPFCKENTTLPRRNKLNEYKKRAVFRTTLLVRTKGLEPPRLTALDPKSSAATNYATCANAVQRYCLLINCANFGLKTCLDATLYIPNKCTETEFGRFHIHCVKSIEHSVNTVVFNKCDDCRCH